MIRSIMGSRTVVAVFAALLLLAACDSSGNNDDSGGSDGGSSDPAENLSGEPIMLMVMASGGEGTDLDTSNVPDAAEVAAKAIEADGGINGRPVEIVPCFDGFDPNEAAACARTAVDDGALAVVGSFVTFGDNYVPVLEEAGVPTVAPFAISFPEFTSELSFPIIGGAPSTTAGMGAQLADVEDSTVINVSFLDIAQGAQAATLVQEGLTPRGLEIASETPVPDGAVDFAPQIAAATEGGTDGIVLALSNDQAPGYVREVAQTGSDVPIAVSSAAITAADVESLGADAEGLQINSNFKPVTLDDPGVERFVGEVDEYDPDLQIDDAAMNAWSGVHLVAEALEGKPDATPSDLVDALNVVNGVDLGLSPPISFDQPATPLFGGAITRIFNPGVLYTEVRDGEVVAIDGDFIDPFVAP